MNSEDLKKLKNQQLSKQKKAQDYMLDTYLFTF